MAAAAAGNYDQASNVVARALMTYIGKGCTLVIDNFCNNLDLTHYLLENKNHLDDVLRQNVKGVPQDVLQNTQMKKRDCWKRNSCGKLVGQM
jgi:hypothetical protein